MVVGEIYQVGNRPNSVKVINLWPIHVIASILISLLPLFMSSHSKIYKSLDSRMIYRQISALRHVLEDLGLFGLL